MTTCKIEPHPWPVEVQFARASPMAKIFETLSDPERARVFQAETGCDYYLASCSVRHRRIVELYDFVRCELDELEYNRSRLGRVPRRAFTSPCRSAYLVYMDFEAFLVVARAAQDRLFDLLRRDPNLLRRFPQLNSRKFKSMNDLATKAATVIAGHELEIPIAAYWRSSGALLRALRNLYIHSCGISDWPSAQYDCTTKAIHLPTPTNVARQDGELASRRGLVFDGPDILEYTAKTLRELQDVALTIAAAVVRSITSEAQ